MKALIVLKDFDKYKKNDIFMMSESAKKLELYKQPRPDKLMLMDVPAKYDKETYDLVHTEAQPEKWTKTGEEDKLVQPTVTVWEKDGVKVYEEPQDSTGWSVSTESDDTWTHVPATQESWEFVEDQSKVTAIRQEKANQKLDQLRAARKSKLEEADYLVFKAEDNQEDAQPLRDYRKALRAITDAHKKQDGSAKLATEDLDVDNYSWPVKP